MKFQTFKIALTAVSLASASLNGYAKDLESSQQSIASTDPKQELKTDLRLVSFKNIDSKDLRYFEVALSKLKTFPEIESKFISAVSSYNNILENAVDIAGLKEMNLDSSEGESLKGLQNLANVLAKQSETIILNERLALLKLARAVIEKSEDIDPRIASFVKIPRDTQIILSRTLALAEAEGDPKAANRVLTRSKSLVDFIDSQISQKRE